MILMSYSSVNVRSCIIKIIFFIKLNGGNIIYKRLFFNKIYVSRVVLDKVFLFSDQIIIKQNLR